MIIMPDINKLLEQNDVDFKRYSINFIKLVQ